MSPQHPPLTPGTLLQNRYRVLDHLKAGGMGAVYLAEDERLGKTVALKETFYSDERMRKAFEREARLLANLEHPGLPPVTDHFSEDEGQFLVMRYVPGDDLDTLLKKNAGPFPLREVLEWADQLLDVLEYLHEQEPPVIHRDIKPGNLKFSDGRMVLLDFGLAKGRVKGMSYPVDSVPATSLHYSPLEQFHGKATDPRSDLYSLGATLYHLLTGSQVPTAPDRFEEIRSGRPDLLPPAAAWTPHVPVSVAQAIHHTLALYKEDRPSCATELRAMLAAAGRVAESRAYDYDEDVEASRGAGMAPELNDGEVILPELKQEKLLEGNKEAQLRINEEIFAEVNNDIEDEVLTQEVSAAAALPTAREGSILAHDLHPNAVVRPVPPPPEPSGESGDAPNQAPASSAESLTPGRARGRELPLVYALIIVTLLGAILTAFYSWRRASETRTNDPQQPLTSSPSTPQKVGPATRVTNTVAPDAAPTTSKPLRVLKGSGKSTAFSPDGRTLASGGNGAKVSLWDVRNGSLVRAIQTAAPVRGVAFSPDGATLALGESDNKVELWDLRTARRVRVLTGSGDVVESITFSKDGRLLATAGSFVLNARSGGKIELWDVASGDLTRLLEGAGKNLTSVAFSPDGSTLACAGGGMSIQMWDVKDGRLLRTLSGHTKTVQAVTFSPDGRYLASGGADAALMIWDAATGRLIRSLKGNDGPVNAVAFSPDSGMLASGGNDKLVRLWDVQTGGLLKTLAGHSDYVMSVAFSPDGSLLASGSYDDLTLLWQAEDQHRGS